MKFIRSYILEIIVFLSGALVMVVELIGSRIFSPYVGTSIYVWASLIGVVLASLSIGYYLGGYLSKRDPNISFLSHVLCLAGISVALLAVVKNIVLPYAVALGVQWGSITGAIILFAPVSILLGIVSPYALRLKVKKIEAVGGVAGNLYALSTLGSIVGTFATGFYLIPTFKSTDVLIAVSSILVVLSLAGKQRLAKLLILAAIISTGVALHTKQTKYVYETDSVYNHIRVVDYHQAGKILRALLLATEFHSIINTQSDEIVTPYVRLYRLDDFFKQDIKNALTIGGGAYVSPLDFLKRHPTSTMTVVELDPAVTKTAQRFFNLNNDGRLTIIHDDGRIFLNNNETKFDAIYGDAFSSYFSIPFHLTTIEAIEKINESLTTDGIFVLNIIGALEGEKAAFFQAEYKTISTVFSQVYVFPTTYYDGSNRNKLQNIVLVASKNPIRVTHDDLIAKTKGSSDEALASFYWKYPIQITSNTTLLTDEYAPVDNLVARYLSR